jgi:hypothetical protein
MVMRSGLLALAFIAMMNADASAARLEPVRAGHDSFIHRAVFADGRLWLLTDAGLLSTIAAGRDKRVEIALPEPALDLWLQDGRPAVITCRRDRCTDWTIRQRIGETWAVTAKIPTAGDQFIALSSAGAGLTLLSSRRIIEVTGKTQRATALSLRSPTDAINPKGIVTSMHVAPTSILVGFNAGEWGGGLQRIDRRTGETSGQPCDGPLNLGCDPVNGIVAEPWKPDCVTVAIGMVHFLPHGRIVEVCGDAVTPLYVKPMADSDPATIELRQTDASYSTVAFFGLVRRGDTLWAAGIDGIYRVGADGVTQSASLPTFKQVGGLSVSFDMPDLVVLLTDINQRRSMSGSVPLLVPR